MRAAADNPAAPELDEKRAAEVGATGRVARDKPASPPDDDDARGRSTDTPMDIV